MTKRIPIYFSCGGGAPGCPIGVSFDVDIGNGISLSRWIPLNTAKRILEDLKYCVETYPETVKKWNEREKNK